MQSMGKCGFSPLSRGGRGCVYLCAVTNRTLRRARPEGRGYHRAGLKPAPTALCLSFEPPTIPHPLYQAGTLGRRIATITLCKAWGSVGSPLYQEGAGGVFIFVLTLDKPMACLYKEQ